MAMLAEPRRKVRYTVNPTGKNWTQLGGSGSVFGQKMLHSMGWREGQGLGKDGQGAPEPVQVKRKSDQRGVGCSSAYAAETMPQSVDFASLLSQLNADHASGGGSGGEDESRPTPPPAVASVSLEAKSRASKARLHYHKFTRGKDVSAYDPQSLACIFGSRKTAAKDDVGVEKRVDNKQREADQSTDDEGNSVSCVGFGFHSNSALLGNSRSESCLQAVQQQPPPQSGLQLVQSQTSLQDYFRAKMHQLQQRKLQQHSRQPDNHDTDDAGVADHWTSESSCSNASTPVGELDDDGESQEKRVCFHLSPSSGPAVKAEVEASATASAAAAVACDRSDYPDDLTVIDFNLFPGCAFQWVLGYRYY